MDNPASKRSKTEKAAVTQLAATVDSLHLAPIPRGQVFEQLPDMGELQRLWGLLRPGYPTVYHGCRIRPFEIPVSDHVDKFNVHFHTVKKMVSRDIKLILAHLQLDGRDTGRLSFFVTLTKRKRDEYEMENDGFLLVMAWKRAVKFLDFCHRVRGRGEAAVNMTDIWAQLLRVDIKHMGVDRAWPGIEAAHWELPKKEAEGAESGKVKVKAEAGKVKVEAEE